MYFSAALISTDSPKSTSLRKHCLFLEGSPLMQFLPSKRKPRQGFGTLCPSIPSWSSPSCFATRGKRGECHPVHLPPLVIPAIASLGGVAWLLLTSLAAEGAPTEAPPWITPPQASASVCLMALPPVPG